ncbi:MAG TPA: glycosyltransferase family A protein [Mucilaginibacter sp.]|jgi:glycosyltransferase involved in cell wall biosynthesis|nr:glycosyltransferase family A protein [Mucilaginibacter sp.]
MDQSLISIIIPVYNSEQYLAETISSALAQTWPNKEVIIVDDGSTDGSLAVAESFASDAVKVFSQGNKGASVARNKGLQEAKGKYIQFLDADDLLMPDKIEKQIGQLKGSIDTLSICPVVHFYYTDNLSNLKPNDNELSLYKASKEPFEFLLKLYGSESNKVEMVPVHSWLTPVGLIKKAGKWDETLTVNDDGEFFCRVVLASAGILPVTETLCYYRKYTGKKSASLSGRKDIKSLESHYHSLMLIKDHLTKSKEDRRINKVTAANLKLLLMQVYPKYKMLAKSITEDIKQLGGTSFSPVLGGRTIEFIKKNFGWKTARLLQFYLYKVI